MHPTVNKRRKKLLTHHMVLLLVIFGSHTEPVSMNSNIRLGKIAEMEEVDILVDDPILLNCTLRNPYRNINSSVMYFMFGNTRVDEQYVTRPNAMTIQLNITATLDMKGHVFCRAENYTETLAHQVVEVHNRPIKPYNLTCVVKDWKSMECSWEPSAEEQRKHTNLTTNQTLYWVLLKQSDLNPCNTSSLSSQTCNQYTANSCNESNSKSCPNCAAKLCEDPGLPVYCTVYVGVFHLVHPDHCAYSSETIEWRYAVQPGPVLDLKAVNVSSSSAKINWVPSEAWGHRSLMYTFHIASPYDKEFQAPSVTSDMPQLSTVIEDGIKPYRNYSITVRCMPWFKNEAKGFWSDPVTIHVLTNESVPASAPVVTSGTFKVDPHNHKVEIYWKPIPLLERNGKLTEIRIRYRSDGGESLKLKVPPSHTSATLEGINGILNYTVSVDAATTVGFNKTLQLNPIRITAASQRLAIPAEFVVRYNKSAGQLLFSWDKVQGASGYTIYWCHGSNSRECSENRAPLVWLKVPASVTNHTLPFEDVAKVKDYSFGISAEQQTHMSTISSGLGFIECSYDATEILPPPRDVEFAPDSEQNLNSLKIIWNYRKCQPHAAYVQYYVLSYKKKEEKDGGEQLVYMSPEDRFAVIPELEAEQVYTISVHSMSKWQQSQVLLVGEKRVRGGLSHSAKIGIGFGVTFVSIFIVIGISSIVCFLRKKYRKMKKGPVIVLPDNVTRFEEPEEDDEDDAIVSLSKSGVTFLPEDISRKSKQELLQDTDHQPLLNGHNTHNSSGRLGSCHPQMSGDSAMGPSLNSSNLEYIRNQGVLTPDSYSGADGRERLEEGAGAAGDHIVSPRIGAAIHEGGAENPNDHHPPTPLPHTPIENADYGTSGRLSISAYSKIADSPRCNANMSDNSTVTSVPVTLSNVGSPSSPSPKIVTADERYHVPLLNPPGLDTTKTIPEVAGESPRTDSDDGLEVVACTKENNRDLEPPKSGIDKNPVLNSAGYVIQPVSGPVPQVQPRNVEAPLDIVKVKTDQNVPVKDTIHNDLKRETVLSDSPVFEGQRSVPDTQKSCSEIVNNGDIETKQEIGDVLLSYIPNYETAEPTPPSIASNNNNPTVKAVGDGVESSSDTVTNPGSELGQTLGGKLSIAPTSGGYISEDQLSILHPT